jgi:quercetin dioxygenase-like cupin family protein
MLQGKIEYRYGKRSYVLAPGDSLTFKGSVPHGPKKLIKLPIRFLSIFIYGDESGPERPG